MRVYVIDNSFHSIFRVFDNDILSCYDVVGNVHEVVGRHPGDIDISQIELSDILPYHKDIYSYYDVLTYLLLRLAKALGDDFKDSVYLAIHKPRGMLAKRQSTSNQPKQGEFSINCSGVCFRKFNPLLYCAISDKNQAKAQW